MATFRVLSLIFIALSLANGTRALAVVGSLGREASFGFRVPKQWHTEDCRRGRSSELRMGTQPSNSNPNKTSLKKRKKAKKSDASDGTKKEDGWKLLSPPSIASPHDIPSWAAPPTDIPSRINSGGGGQRSNNDKRGDGRRDEKSKEKDLPSLPRSNVKRKKRKNSNNSRNSGHDNSGNQSSSSTSTTMTIPPFSLASNKDSKPSSSKTILDVIALSIDSTDPLFPNTPSSSLADIDDADLGDVMSSPIEGVLPVSELFYRSTQSLSQGGGVEGEGGTEDDEELPFSAEQSNQLSTTGHNKIHIRRSNAETGDGGDGNSVALAANANNMSKVVRRELKAMAEQEKEEQRQYKKINQQILPLKEADKSQRNSKKSKANKKGNNSSSNNHNNNATAPPPSRTRKMVRRGMEMLVGGEPINADPPQRYLELHYHGERPPHQLFDSITTSSPDFGPLLHRRSASRVSRLEQGLFCERFVGVTKKWRICPRDLAELADAHEERRRRRREAEQWLEQKKSSVSVSEEDMDTLIAMLTPPSEGDANTGLGKDTGSNNQSIINSHVLDAPKGFGAQQNQQQRRMNTSHQQPGLNRRSSEENVTDTPLTLGGELKFSLAVRRSDLECSHAAFRRVLTRGIDSSIGAEGMGFNVRISKLVIVTSDEGGSSTDVVVQFQLEPQNPGMNIEWATRAAHEVNGALASAMDDGRMAVALAGSAREEEGWSEEMRDNIVEQFLFETEEDDDNNGEKEKKGNFEASGDTEPNSDDPRYNEEKDNNKKYDGPFGMEGDVIYAKDDIWLGGGNRGVFFDYSKSNSMNSPYKGNLGPCLLDAAIERAKQNQPRVIAIGDVHGCIDELQALLRKCDYHPGDLIVFLGDLVCKGPDSPSVVQLAREVGAIGVRGNHDFEVVRWHQAIKSGADPPLIGSEHYHVASSLGAADLRWLYSLPWFVSSPHLNALFVHAGFVSGIRLAKQNPRLMMNMRSILPDGTVTSKFFNNWPWARLWDGPQTVFFGHDADRGLQEYEHGMGLDTGCVYGGKLTACILPERRIVSVNAKQEYFQYRRKHFN